MALSPCALLLIVAACRAAADVALSSSALIPSVSPTTTLDKCLDQCLAAESDAPTAGPTVAPFPTVPITVAPTRHPTQPIWVYGYYYDWRLKGFGNSSSSDNVVVPFCDTYDLCDVYYVVQATGDEYTEIPGGGYCVALAGPEFNHGPWGIEFNMDREYTFTRWRMTSEHIYSTGRMVLQYNNTGDYVDVQGSEIDGIATDNYQQSGRFAPVTSANWRVKITTAMALQSMWVCEVQFATEYPLPTALPTTPAPSVSPAPTSISPPPTAEIRTVLVTNEVEFLSALGSQTRIELANNISITNQIHLEDYTELEISGGKGAYAINGRLASTGHTPGCFYVTASAGSTTQLAFVGLTLSYCVANTDGAALEIQSGSVGFTDVQFIGNQVIEGTIGGGDGGGALFVGGAGAIVSLNGCIFRGNSHFNQGGALGVFKGNVDVIGCTFEQNQAFSEAAEGGGGAISTIALGGGVGDLILNIIDCVIRDNYASDYGGALYLEGGLTTISNSDISSNEAQTESGGIYFYTGGLNILATHLLDNFRSDGTAQDLSGPNAFYAVCGSLCKGGSYGNWTGYYAVLAGNADRTEPCPLYKGCIDCPRGKYSNVTDAAGEDTCLSCSAGRVSQGAASFCEKCSPGKFATFNLTDTGGGVKIQTFSGATNCNSCPPGRYTKVASMVVCSACNPGKFSTAGGSFCDICPKGKVSGAGQGLCTDCPSGKFSSIPGSSSCSPCPVLRTSLAGSTSCNLAVEGYFIDPQDNSSTVECPAHAKCRGSHYLPSPEKGYWCSRSQPEYTATLAKCTRNTCTGATANNASCWIAGNLNMCNADDLLCKGSATGPLCGSCAPRHTFDSITATCVPCRAHLSFVNVACMALLVVCVALFLALRHARIRLPGGFPSIARRVRDVWRHVDRGSLKICWNTYQIVQSISSNMNVDFPEPFSSSLGYLSFMSFDFLSAECLFHHVSYYQKVYAIALGPGIAVFFLVGVYFVWAKCRGDRISSASFEDDPAIKKSDRENFLDNSGNEPDEEKATDTSGTLSRPLLDANNRSDASGANTVKEAPSGSDNKTQGETSEASAFRRLPYVVLLLTYVMLPPVMHTLLTSLDCFEYIDSHYLRLDTSVDCDSAGFKSFRVVTLVITVLYSGIPLVWSMLLFNIREQLSPATRKVATYEKDTVALEFLFSGYRTGCEHTETFEIYRRILIVGVLPLIFEGDRQRGMLGMFFAVISIIVWRETQPFENSFNNGLVVCAQYVILLTFGAAVAIVTGGCSSATDEGDWADSTLFGVLLVVCNLLVVMLAGYLAVRTYRRQQNWAALPHGLKHHFFLSHYQKNSGDQCNTLFCELTRRQYRVWWDNKMPNITEESMIRGVQESEVFILFLNTGTLSREFVRLEIDEAIRQEDENKKKILLIRETDGRKNAPLDDEGRFSLDEVWGDDEKEKTDIGKFRQDRQDALNFEDTDEEEFQKQVESDVKEEERKNRIRDYFQREGIYERIIPFTRRSPFSEAMYELIIDQAELSHRSSNLKQTDDVEPPPLPRDSSKKYHVLITCAKSGEPQRESLTEVLRRRKIVVCDNSEELELCMSLLVFLTDEVMKDPQVQYIIREAKRRALPVLLVHETEKCHGAPLNDDKNFDFRRIFNDQAPDDLKLLGREVEVIPFHRNCDRFVEAMCDALLMKLYEAMDEAQQDNFRASGRVLLHSSSSGSVDTDRK